MDKDKLQLLESVLGKSFPAHRDNHTFTCPFCAHPKLNVALSSGKWGCWRCGQGETSKSKGHSVSILFKRVNASRDNIKLAKELWNEKVRIKPTIDPVILKLPVEYKPLWEPSISFFYKKAKSYILNRGLTERDIIKYRIGYCESGQYDQMIILPSYDDNGHLNFFTGRSFVTKLFKVPENIDKNVITYEDQILWDEPIILVESQLDAITIRRNVIPLNGKAITDQLKARILKEKVPKIILFLDGDALSSVMKNAVYFIQNGIEVSKVNIPEDEDPNSLGFEKAWEYIDNAEPITNNQSFKFKILSKLN